MTLLEKLNSVYDIIDHVEKRGHNKFQDYDYIRAADVTNAIRGAFIKLKIYAEMDFAFEGAPYTIAREKSPNAPFSARDVKCTALFHDLESSETARGTGLGTGADTGDKAAYKAQTGALKYCLKNAFLVPDEADPEADEKIDEQASSASAHPDSRPARSAQAAPKAAAPKAAAPKAQAAPTTKPISASAASGSIQPAQSTATATATAASSGAPAPAAVPSETVSAPDAGREPGDDSDLPNEAELTDYRNKFTKLADDLSTTGKLKSSRGLPVNRKLLVFLLQTVGANDAKNVTKTQWDKFFSRVDATRAQGDEGLVKLAGLVNTANGIEPKEKK